jgi:hypothetical protein
MCTWSPAAILPNLSSDNPIDGEVVAFAPCRDRRVQEFCDAHPKFSELISRFTDAFGVPITNGGLLAEFFLAPFQGSPNVALGFRCENNFRTLA